MTSERYQAYLEALEHIDRINSDQAGTRNPELLRELVQDVFLCRDPGEAAQLLDQVATAVTELTTAGALGRDASTDLWIAAIESGPSQPHGVAERAPELVGS